MNRDEKPKNDWCVQNDARAIEILGGWICHLINIKACHVCEKKYYKKYLSKGKIQTHFKSRSSSS
jgi:hypothetical protein